MQSSYSLRTLLPFLFLITFGISISQASESGDLFQEDTTTKGGGRLFYVSSSTGNDDNDGLSMQSPWQSTVKVNESNFLPGDSILFKRGDSWDYSLVVTSDGTRENPITYGAYGEGPLPRIAAESGPPTSFAALRIDRKSNIVIDSLEFTGRMRYGIFFSSCNNLTIKNSYIHHILEEMWHCVTGGGSDIHLLNNEIAYCGLEGFYGSGERIEIGHNHFHHTDMVSAENGCVGKGDVIQLNCWSPEYSVHHNILDHSNSCGGKGAFISSHCTLDCLDNEPRCTDDISSQTSNGIFEHNTVISGDNDNFGFTNSGYGDTVRHNRFFYDYKVDKMGERAEFAAKSEKGLLFHHNVAEGYGSGISLGKDGAIFDIYNNLFATMKYTLWGSTDIRSATINVKNNLFLGQFQHTRSNSNQLIRYSHNVATVGFGNGTSGSGTIVDLGENNVFTEEQLRLKNVAQKDYTPLSSSPLNGAGTDVGLIHSGSTPSIGPFEYLFPWELFHSSRLDNRVPKSSKE